MSEKPTCTKCGQEHWRFVPCENSEQSAARDRELAIQREKLKVIPQPKHDKPRRQRFSSDHYVMVAPGKYVRKDR